MVRKLCLGNRAAYLYTLVNVQTSGSKLYTPFKKILGYFPPETTSPNTSTINVAANTPSRGGTGNNDAFLTFAATAESQGNIIVWGLL